ncbi:ANTAR domain-containing protein, partial [Rhodococcus sp. IEGM 1354]|uniref:ANTAR domain-containing protein n=1 Tax=Rhodococcus sp. IEGM 1354 TaxID=3047088 RepID=UPI0024B7F808
MSSRDIIGQAKVMLMERYGIDAVQAFDMISRQSQTENLPLATLASQHDHLRSKSN